MNLLIINDEQLTADTLREDIDWQACGIAEVYAVYSAKNAKACMRERKVDILLCDIEMPEENGLELLRWVRENAEDSECVFLTCHASFDYAREAIRLGCQDYVLMPAPYEDIAAAVSAAAARLKKRREQTAFREYGEFALRQSLKGEREERDDAPDPGDGANRPEVLAEQVEETILENLRSSELNVDSLAARMHFHPVYLNRLFKKEKGISIGQFIINERMKLAGSILETGTLSAQETAEHVGYNHYTNFYNMFKKYYGMTPAQYQEARRR